MAWQKLEKFGGDSLPSEYICADADVKITEEEINGEIIEIVPGSTLWVWDAKQGYVFADGDWRAV